MVSDNGEVGVKIHNMVMICLFLAHVITQYPASLLTIIIYYSPNSQAVPFVVDERGLCHVGSCLRRFNQDKEILRGLVDPVVVDGDGHDEVIIQVVRGWDGQPLGHPWEVLTPINLNCREQLCSNSTMRIFLLLCRLMSTTACSTWLQKTHTQLCQCSGNSLVSLPAISCQIVGRTHQT